MSTVGIVGAGVGALTLALACRELGVTCTVYPFPVEPVDRVVELTANGARVLHALGLRESLAERALEPSFSHVRTARAGTLLVQRPLGAFSTARYGAPCYLIRGAALAELLEEACRSTGVDFVDPAANAPPCPGPELPHDIEHAHALVVATGALDRFVPALATEPDGNLVVRAVLTADCGTNVETWVRPAAFASIYPLEEGGVLHALIARTSDSASPDPADLLRRTFDGSQPALERALDALEQVEVSPGHAGATSDVWFDGRIARLGDACHALPAHATQRACAAIEDAWVLATMIERWEDDPAQGLPDYQRFRLPRCEKLRRHAVAKAAELTLERNVWSRNVRLAMTSRFLPELSMQQEDWLYGYDCIKGFV